MTKSVLLSVQLPCDLTEEEFDDLIPALCDEIKGDLLSGRSGHVSAYCDTSYDEYNDSTEAHAGVAGEIL